MAGYIGAKVGTVTANAADIKGDISATDTTPEITLKNTTETDADGSRGGKITFKGEQSGGEESTLANIQASHDGTADDEKADLIFRTNDGSDGASPTERVRIDSNGSILTATLGTDNVHLGEGAGASIASGGDRNITIGKNAGTAITTGDRNVGVGHQALLANTVGSRYNTAVGHEAGAAITTGTNNTTVGALAGDALTTGGNNTVVGYEALSTEDGHGNNTAVGYQSLKVQNAGLNAANTALGYQAGVAVTDGHSNTLIGTLAGSVLTTGDENTYVGYSAGSSGTATFTGNTALGFNSFAAGANIGDSNTAIGWSTLKNTNAGAAGNGHNTAVGYNAGRGNDTGYDNTFIGSQAGESVSTGNDNTFIGKGSGSTMTTGNNNTILGRFNGNQNSVDIRASTDNIILSDGNGYPRVQFDSTGKMHIRQSVTSHMIFADNANTSYGSVGISSWVNRTSSGGNYFFFSARDTAASQYKWYVRDDGDNKNVSGNYGAISDRKLKENISDANSQWEDIKALRVRKFSFKDRNLDEANMIGVIAQEVEEAGMVNLVDDEFDRDNDGNVLETTTKTFKYSILYMKAVKALQEAMTRIETLETQNTTQATQIADLITRVTALEAE